MIIESSIKLRLGAKVEVLQLVYTDNKLIKEFKVYGYVVRPATKEEYMQEGHTKVREDKYYYYEVRTIRHEKEGDPKHHK